MGIKKIEVETALRKLAQEEFIAFRDNKWEKLNLKTRFPTRHSMEIVRNFHGQMIRLAFQNLIHKNKESDFQNRSINGITFAANPLRIAEAKEKLNAAIFEIAEFLAEGECTEVFQLNCQLFPLTQK